MIRGILGDGRIPLCSHPAAKDKKQKAIDGAMCGRCLSTDNGYNEAYAEKRCKYRTVKTLNKF